MVNFPQWDVGIIVKFYSLMKSWDLEDQLIPVAMCVNKVQVQCIDSLAPGRCGCNFKFSPQTHLTELVLNCFQMKTREYLWWLFSIGLGNGLVPSGNKTLPEPMLAQIYVYDYTSKIVTASPRDQWVNAPGPSQCWEMISSVESPYNIVVYYHMISQTVG